MSMFALLLLASIQVQDSADVLITGGTVYDGSGGAAQRADIGIRGDRIVFVGDARAGAAQGAPHHRRTGLIVSPGFIDPHTHAYEGLPGWTPNGAAERVVADAGHHHGRAWRGRSRSARRGARPGRVRTRGHRHQHVRARGFRHGAQRVMGGVVGASHAGADRLHARAHHAGNAGRRVRRGLRAVLRTAELREHGRSDCRVSAAKPFGGVYDTHQRDESSYTHRPARTRCARRFASAARPGLTANVGHIKALGVDVWGKADSVLGIMREARARGCKVDGRSVSVDGERHGL